MWCGVSWCWVVDGWWCLLMGVVYGSGVIGGG